MIDDVTNVKNLQTFASIESTELINLLQWTSLSDLCSRISFFVGSLRHSFVRPTAVRLLLVRLLLLYSQCEDHLSIESQKFDNSLEK